jgi:hypothetical protein
MGALVDEAVVLEIVECVLGCGEGLGGGVVLQCRERLRDAARKRPGSRIADKLGLVACSLGRKTARGPPQTVPPLSVQSASGVLTDGWTHLTKAEVVHEDLPKLRLPILKKELEPFTGDS